MALDQDWSLALKQLPLRHVSSGSRTFSYRGAGTGESMLFLHGISSGSGSWIHLIGAFQARARCIAWDAPGYGGSTPLETPNPTAAEYSETLGYFLDSLAVDRTWIVAHSLGALMATAFAARHPERVRGMVLLDPASGYGCAPREIAEAKKQNRLEQLERLGIEGLATTRAAALVSPQASAGAVELIQWNMRRLSADGYAQATRMLSAGDLLSDAAYYPGPVLVACGSEDTITPESACRRVADSFAHGEYSTLPGLGHASYIEDPDMVEDRIATFRMRALHD